MKPRLKKITVAILVIAILGNGLFAARSAQALDVGSKAAKFGKCYAGSVVSDALARPINTVLSKIKGRISKAVTGKLRKIQNGVNHKIDEGIGAGLNALGTAFGVPGLGGLLGFGNTQVVQDDGTRDGIAEAVDIFMQKTYRDDIITRCVARTIMNNLILNTDEIVRTRGRDGGATFVKDWTQFQLQSEHRGENLFRAMLSNTQVCDYFANDFKSSYGLQSGQKIDLKGKDTRTGSLEPYSVRAGCNLPPGFDMAAYENDFAGNGGWDAWARLLQPQNNPGGSLFLAQDEISKQRALQQSADVNQAVAGGGHLGISGNGKADSCLVAGPNGDCIIYKEIKTPGSYIGSSIDAAIAAEFNWLANTQNFNSIIADATEAMLGRLLDFSNPNEDSYKLPEDAGIGVPTPTPEFSSLDQAVQSCIQTCIQESGESFDLYDGDGKLATRTVICTSQCQNAIFPIATPTPTPGPHITPGGNICASQAEIDKFLRDNPGDQGRLPQAFPCNH